MKPLSNKARYALRALQSLARPRSGSVLIADLAREEGVPRKFLEVILLELKNHGLLDSRRGKGGGYALRKDPSQITLGQVIRILDGPLAPLPCVSETAFNKCDDCPDLGTCGTRLVMREVRDAIAGILDRTTLADVARRVEQARSDKDRSPMYHI